MQTIIDQHEDDYNRLTEEGPKHLTDEDDLQTQTVKQQLDDVIAGWRELQTLWERRRELLEENMNYQVRRKTVATLKQSLMTLRTKLNNITILFILAVIL